MTKELTTKLNYTTLSHEEQSVLKQIWTCLFDLWGKNSDPNVNNHLIKKESDSASSTTTATTVTDTANKSSIHEQFQKILNLDANALYEEFWEMLRLESPDCNLLRFARARNFNLDETIKLLSRNFKFRLERNINDAVNQGEFGIFHEENKPLGIIKNLELQKVALAYRDKEGRPIILVRPKLHFSRDQTEDELEKFAIYVIEITRLFMKEGNATILFDLNGFTLSNMDYTPVKFIITCFEAHYPESLGSLLIYKAPWLFSPIWAIVKNWLDPVVASKVVFAKNLKDLTKYVDMKQIPGYMGGENIEFDLETYTAPEVDGLLKNDDTKASLLKIRSEIINKFESITKDWIQETDPAKSQKLWDIKCELGESLCDNYSQLDPYIRTRCQYDTQGFLNI